MSLISRFFLPLIPIVVWTGLESSWLEMIRDIRVNDRKQDLPEFCSALEIQMNKHISKTSQKLSLHYSKSLVFFEKFLQSFSKVFAKFILRGGDWYSGQPDVMVTIVKRIICVLFSLWKKLMYRRVLCEYRRYTLSNCL